MVIGCRRADRALRLLVQTQKPLGDYAPGVLPAVLERIGEERRRARRLLSRRGGTWEAGAS